MTPRGCSTLAVTALLLSTLAGASAQRPESAPETAPSGKPPDTVFLEDLTWAEVRDLIKTGTTTVIIGTAGTEQKGPHMVDGEHKFVMEYTADKIARAIGKTLVAPVVTYVPEGSWENPAGHMAKPGTITLPDDRFVELLVNAGKSLKAGGFTNILFIGESGGNRNGMRDRGREAERVLERRGARAYWIDDYYTKAHADQNTCMHRRRSASRRTRSATTRTSSTRPSCCSSTPKHIRRERLTGNDYENNGVSGNNQAKSTPEIGKALLQIKIDNAVAQIKALMAGTSTRQQSEAPAAPKADGGGRGGRGRGGARAGVRPTNADDSRRR